MSTLSYLNYDDIGAFEGLYQQYQQAPDSVDGGWRYFIEGFEFSKADFSQGNKKVGYHRLTRLLLKPSRYLCWMQPRNTFFKCIMCFE